MKYAWHVIKYILVFIVNLLILLFVHSYLNLIILILMIVMPVVSVIMAHVSINSLSVKFGGADEPLTVDEPFLMTIILRNDSIIPNMNTDISISMENDLFNTSGEYTLCIPAYMKDRDTVDYQLSQSLAGVLHVSATEIHVTDWMGFVRLKRRCSAARDYVVYPSGSLDSEPDMSALSQGMDEAEESGKKGYDFFDVVDVREYIPGDKLQNIHWKLSAKKDILMVKERESMSSSQLIVLVELYNDQYHVLNDVLKAAYGLAEYLISQQIPCTYYYWSTAGEDMIQTAVDNIDDLREWMEKLFYEKSYNDSTYGISMLQRILDADRKILCITADGQMDGSEVFTYGQRVKGYISE